MHHLDDSELTWLWAYNEQLQLLDRHDALWIDLARHKCWQDSEFARFLKTYGLIRGEAGAIVFAKAVHKKREAFARIFTDHFDDIASMKTIEELDTFWRNVAVGELAAVKHINLNSATSKTLWFYRPDIWIMYDSRNKRGLSVWLAAQDGLHVGDLLAADNFVTNFNRFYTSIGRQGADFAAQYFSRPYPYPQRVAEKYLWLIGHGRDVVRQKLDAYRKSLELAPSSIEPTTIQQPQADVLRDDWRRLGLSL